MNFFKGIKQEKKEGDSTEFEIMAETSEVVEEAPIQEGSWVKEKDIFVGNLSLYTTNDSLREFFAKYGVVSDVRIMIHPETKRSRRFGFVTFASEASVQEALKSTDKHCLDGKVLDVKHAFKKSDEEGGLPPVKKTKKPFLPKEMITDASMIKAQPPDIKVFVGGISKDTTKDQLKAHFSKFGYIDKLNLLLDQETNRHRGFAFIEYATEHFAELACTNQFHTINGKKVEVKKALHKGQPQQLVGPAQFSATTFQLPFMPFMFWPNFSLENQALAFAAQAGSARCDINRSRFAPYPVSNATLQPHHLGSIQEGSLYPLQTLLLAAHQCQSFFPTLLPPQSEYRPPVLYPMLRDESKKHS